MSVSIPPQLPDIRVLGVVLRTLILAEGIHVVTVLAHAKSLDQAVGDFLHGAVLFEPILLTALVLLYSLSPWLVRVRYAVGVVVVVAVVLAALAFWFMLFSGLDVPLASHPVGAVVGAVSVTAAILFYFRWRQVRLAPELAHANFLALQARIRPHFLFNSLNSVLSLMPEDPKRAEAMLENLSDLFRAVLSEAGSLVALGQEIELTKTYLDIESIRLGERLRVSWDCDPEVNAVLLPPLVLQPLVENAIVHGVAQCPQGGLIKISTTRRRGELVLTVSNPLPVNGSQAHSGSQTALENIKSRLEMHFDVEGRLEVEASQSQFEVQIWIPLHDSGTHQSHHR